MTLIPIPEHLGRAENAGDAIPSIHDILVDHHDALDAFAGDVTAAEESATDALDSENAAASSATAAASSATAAASSATTAAANVAAIPGVPTFVVAAQSSTHIDVTITLKDASGAALGTAAEATVWLSDTAGAVPGTPPSGAVTVQTGALLKEDTAKILFRIVSNTSGVIVVRIIGTAAVTCFVNAAIGTKSASSGAVTFS